MVSVNRNVPPVCVCVPGVCFMGVHQVVDISKRISDAPEWFKGARLNYAENLLKHADQDKVALYAASKYMKCMALVESCVMYSNK